MSKGNSGLFRNTLGTARANSTEKVFSYSDRGIEIPNYLKEALAKLQKKGDIVSGTSASFSLKDVSILSKETGVEFAKVTIRDKTYLIRGDSKGTYIPEAIIREMRDKNGTLDFHSHPYDNDCIPSMADCKIMRRLHNEIGQTTSKIVTPNGRTVTFGKDGVIEVSNVQNIIDSDAKEIYLRLFGGK